MEKNHSHQIAEAMNISNIANNNSSGFESLNSTPGKDFELKYDALLAENKRLEMKLGSLVYCLEERVSCPVCLELPTTGPIYSCPQGHLVCASCFQGPSSTCPICRSKMLKTVSLLAKTVIENIEHKCKYEDKGCKEKLVADKMEEHRRSCGYRPVLCPSVLCKKTVAFSHLIDHLMNECKRSYAHDIREYEVVKKPTSYIAPILL